MRTQFSTVIYPQKLYHAVILKVIDTALKISLNTIGNTVIDDARVGLLMDCSLL